MSKIICEICGSVYQDTHSEVCPICGWSHNVPVEDDGFDTGMATDEAVAEESAAVSGLGKRNKDIFDFDAVNEEDDEQTDVEDEVSPYEEDELYEEESRPNTFLVVILVIVIAALLLTSGFIFFRYFMPNSSLFASKQTVATVPEETETEAPETEAPTVPCTSLAITSGKAELTRAGQFHLINVVVMPEDTTDKLTFTSENEEIATVSEDGKITAVAEGETNVIVTCGKQAYTIPVLVLYVDDLTPPPETTEETVPKTKKKKKAKESTEASTEAVEETKADSSAETTKAAEATEAEQTTAPQEIDPNIVLKLKRDDVTIGRQGVYIELELDCGLTPDQVEWTVGNQSVATVDKGKVTAVGPGVTIVTVKYGTQTVECYIRCIW